MASLRVEGIDRMQRDDRALRAYGALTVLESDYDKRCEAAEQGLLFDGSGVASPGRVRQLCSAKGTFQTLQYVFYGAGALFAGAGAYFLLSPERGVGKAKSGAATARVWVLPGFGPAPLGGSVGGVF